MRAEVQGLAPPPPPRPLSAQERPFAVMVRNAMWRRVELVARDDVAGLVALEQQSADLADPPLEVGLAATDWDAALEAYYAEHDRVLTDADARGPALLVVDDASVADGRRTRPARQTLHDPEDHHDWVLEALVDLDASDRAGEAVVLTSAMRRLGG